jgi:hypothetical protein
MSRGLVMSFTINKQDLTADIGLGDNGALSKASGVTVATGPRASSGGGTGSGAVWRSRREEEDRRRRRLWFRQLILR